MDCGRASAMSTRAKAGCLPLQRGSKTSSDVPAAARGRSDPQRFLNRMRTDFI